MKKPFIILIALALALPILAQRRARQAKPALPKVTPQEAMEAYNFALAEELLEHQIEDLKKKKQPTIQEEQLLEVARKSQIKLHATEKVVIVDSMVLPKKQVLRQIRLSEECGNIMYCADFFKTTDSNCTLFLNELGNRIIYSEPNKKGHLRLKEKSKIGDEWQMERQLKGLGEEEGENYNFPFMLTDGITIYYAAVCEESIGGYDIFMTRYDADNQQFLAPENVGMPFNSPANDYLMVIDEFQQLGWFVTDRNQPADKVCLYTFIPTPTRSIYNEQEIGAEKLASLARIASIKDTWKDMNAVNAAKKRLAQANSKALTTNGKEENTFAFVVNDHKTCHDFSDFTNPQAQQKAKQWFEMQNDIKAKKTELAAAREKYATASEAGKEGMKSQILLLESAVERLSANRLDLEKEIRKLELKK